MLSQRTAYYGLLTCLVALLALGLQPLRPGKLSAVPQNFSQEAPDRESGDEEEETEEASEEIATLRRNAGVNLPARDESISLAAERPVSPRQAPSPFALSCEHAARNGIGGPLRL